MSRYFIILACLIILPLAVLFLWRATLPTEQQVLDRHAASLAARFEQIKKIRATLPPPGSVKENTLPANLSPRPVCDYRTGECNLQMLEVWHIDEKDRHVSSLSRSSRPDDYARILPYLLARSVRSDPDSPRIGRYQRMIDRAVNARYVMLNRALTEPKPGGGTVTKGMEGFLLDLEETRVLGVFHHPEWDPRTRYPAVASSLDTTLRPEFPLRTNIRTGDVDLATALVGVWCGFMVFFGLTSLPAAIRLSKERRLVRQIKKRGDYPELLPCPMCGQETDRLKQFHLPTVILFAVVVWAFRSDTVTACPKCMRRSICRRYFGNLLPGNIVTFCLTSHFLLLGLSTREAWHSPGVLEGQGSPQEREPPSAEEE